MNTITTTSKAATASYTNDTTATSLDIVKLIEKDSKIALNRPYQNSLLNKIKNFFSSKEQQLFVASFYCYINYDSVNDFVIDFTDVWKWCGFTRKDHAKTLLEKHFTENVDYKVENFAPAIAGAKNKVEKATLAGNPINDSSEKAVVDEEKEEARGGHNKEKITLNVNTFKKFCMKACTKKADEIHDYYIQLEKILHDTLKEQTDELQNQLKEKNEIIETKETQIKKLQRHKQLVEGRNVVYLCTTDDSDDFIVGQTTDLAERLENYNNNKLHNFQIIKHVSCKTVKVMDAVETILLSKFNKYKAVQNRDVFGLPPGKDVSFFTQWFDYINKLCEDIEEDVVLEERTPEELAELAQEVDLNEQEAKSQYNFEYRQAHHEAILEREAKYREDNYGLLRERCAEYRAENHEEILNRQKQGREKADKVKVAENMKKYRAENKEKIAESKKKYNQAHKHIMEEKIKCVCGSTVARQGMTYHLTTSIHKNFLETGKTIQEQLAPETIKCDCGMTIKSRSKRRHISSKIHQAFLITQCQTQTSSSSSSKS